MNRKTALFALTFAAAYSGACLSASASKQTVEFCSSRNYRIASAKTPAEKPKVLDVSGTWYFTSSWRDWHSGTISLIQTGNEFTGTWHTITGKQEADLPISGNVEGDTVHLNKYNIWGKRENQNNFTLSVANGGNQLYGYGEGFFIKHADLNMARTEAGSKSESKQKDRECTTSSEPGAKVPDLSGTWSFSLRSKTGILGS